MEDTGRSRGWLSATQRARPSEMTRHDDTPWRAVERVPENSGRYRRAERKGANSRRRRRGALGSVLLTFKLSATELHGDAWKDLLARATTTEVCSRCAAMLRRVTEIRLPVLEVRDVSGSSKVDHHLDALSQGGREPLNQGDDDGYPEHIACVVAATE